MDACILNVYMHFVIYIAYSVTVAILILPLPHRYAFEGINLGMQLHYTLSERLKSQLIWGRFVNTKGRQGCNMPCDLFLEHLNR